MQVARPLAHGPNLALLWRAAREQRLPHALIFEGRAGIGKYAAAKWFALGCLCERGPGEPCSTCGACKRVLSGGEHGNHPDLFVLDPEDPFLAGDFEKSQQIKLGRIAYRPKERLPDPDYCVERFLELRRSEGRYRPVLIREAQRMNEHAQDALLKTLEEPRAGTVLVLETSRPAMLKPTIRSRCIRVRFEPLSQAECTEVLVAAGQDPESARALAGLAEGSPGRALGMARDGTRALRACLAEVALGARDPLAAAAELGQIEGEFTGATETVRQRERARVVLDLAQALVRDAWRLHAGVPPADLTHGDLAPGLAARASARELERRAWALLAARTDVDHNLAPGAVVERALLVLAEGLAPAAR